MKEEGEKKKKRERLQERLCEYVKKWKINVKDDVLEWARNWAKFGMAGAKI
jgi:polyphosphate kinase 2 (PPK2 family)